MRYPTHLLKVIDILRRLPGVGSKSAERFAFQLINWKKEHLEEMAAIIQGIPAHLHHCQECGCLIGDTLCPFCVEARRSSGFLCILASPRDAFAIEDTHEYHGLYHVLGGLISPLDGFGPEKLQLEKLKTRLKTLPLKEVVIALDSTLEGDTTALYLKKELDPILIPQGVSTSRLAFGLPMGSSLDYVDGGTLARALSSRAKF
jgi:recombination protein RecR